MAQHRRASGARDRTHVVTRTSPGLRVLALGGFGGLALAADVITAAHGWARLADVHASAAVSGFLLGVGLVVASMGIDVRDGEVTIRGFWFAWRGSLWSVRGATNASNLLLEVRMPPTREGRTADDTSIVVSAVQGSVIEQLRGDTRADGAIRRLRNLQAATPVPDEPAPLRRRLRVELVGAALGVAAAQWLLATVLWSMP